MRMGLQLHCLDWDVRDDTTYEQGYWWADMGTYKGIHKSKLKDRKTLLEAKTAESSTMQQKALSNRRDGCKCRKIEKLFFFPDAGSASLLPVCLLRSQFCWTNVISRVVCVGCQSQRAMAHCRFHRRDELGPSRKTTEGHKVYSPHILSLSLPSSVCFFCRHQISWLFPFSKSVHLYWWQCSRRNNTAVVKHWFCVHQKIQCYVTVGEWWGGGSERYKVNQNLT